jgi:hypothetical protein
MQGGHHTGRPAQLKGCSIGAVSSELVQVQDVTA